MSIILQGLKSRLLVTQGYGAGEVVIAALARFDTEPLSARFTPSSRDPRFTAESYSQRFESQSI